MEPLAVDPLCDVGLGEPVVDEGALRGEGGGEAKAGFEGGVFVLVVEGERFDGGGPEGEGGELFEGDPLGGGVLGGEVDGGLLGEIDGKHMVEVIEVGEADREGGEVREV